MNQVVLIERRDGIATVVLNRPDVRNAINLEMWRELQRAAAEVSSDDSIRAVVFRGAGTEAFAAGADISEFERVRKDLATTRSYSAQIEGTLAAIHGCPKPTVAMIFGFCLGGGMAVALACDLRFASEGARFGIPAARLGIVYGTTSTRQLLELVGPSAAKDILYSARTVEGGEALEIGLINRLVPGEGLEEDTYRYMERVAGNAPLSVRGAKLTIEALLKDGAATDRDRIEEITERAIESSDYQEGTRAFLEKRRPRFEGR